MNLGDYAQIQGLQEAGVTAVGLVIMLLKAIKCIVLGKHYLLLHYYAIYSNTLDGYYWVSLWFTYIALSDHCALSDVKDFSLWLPIIFVAIKTVDRMNFWYT